MKKIILLSTFLLSFDCFAVRGDLTKISDAPKSLLKSVVELKKMRDDNTLTHSCTGTIIGNNTILTAAHCFDDKNYKLSVFYKSEHYPINKIMISSDYEKKELRLPYWGDVYDIEIKSDFALIEVSKKFEDKDIVSFYDGDLSSIELSSFIVSGFGQKDSIFGMGKGAGVYRISKKMDLTKFTQDRMRIESNSTGACLGDSGGPLWVEASPENWKQVAVTSQGDCSTFSLFEVIDLKKILNSEYKTILLKI